jgi:hypothetical protein
MNKLRSIFKSTNEELIAQYQFIIDCHMDSIGKCTTCMNYNPPPADTPGFVDDRGDCALNKDIFFKKICASITDEIEECESYKEDARGVEFLSREIERLKEEE